MRPARLGVCCQRAVTTISPGAMVDADTSLPLLLIAASLRVGMRDRVEGHAPDLRCAGPDLGVTGATGRPGPARSRGCF
ncbi:hypothetical protein BB737_26845 [Mycobacterium avium subsp. hominissuis]|uniref:Uncharacterized protein n=4 Tax=Mycobacterium avium complex (MAC) TaxID=120793 RepID=A0ABX3TQA2_9MYCO|nr:hypothetical protein BS641_25895 [Mycobacterium avium subsp. hominissuis]ETZ43615.1 hypothetical protein L837_3733 [Mycobacterium avium MAV_061107_1842]ETZ51521.1 hypothetical protein L838_2953 [Mycobacterium avium MAV_120709_2344]EUA36709.1 hypothetical protein I549_0761 [Mycobacterium avium subsp. avium 2285 (R)]ORA57032.1 hypothetical protein BST19_03765 [Mycobacterium bouchedurhonense]ORB81007.1 hypothetical protein BST46_06210 [Mycobacterium timonense]PAZ98877.1 hypothetical protein C